ncbi:MAG TPA: bifunctional enoyl-CoA hydratase/phosphate acetyltransferase [Thermodesulfobacteriota bacterium]|nr:bifunctional enoyl-CoA hydratase/phosphate acetyltransferase [Thermodesulfobacteriota bacterium]
MAKMSNTTFEEIEIGATATLTRILSKTDIEVLALVSGDANPFHIKSEDDFEVQSDANATQGVGAEALVSAALGTKLPGPGMKIIEQDLRFDGTIAVGDKLTATVTAKEKRKKNALVLFDCRCVNQDGQELVSGTVTVSAPTKKISYSEVAPPQLVLRRGDAFIKLFKACEEIPPVVCAVVHPCDKNSLLGPVEAAKRGIIEPVLVGPEDRIRGVAEAEGVDLSPYRIVPTLHSHAAAEKAVELARAGEVEALMKGSLHTDELLAPVVPSATGLRTSRRISHVFVMDVPSYPRMLLITDAAINIYPKLEEKVDIVQNAIDLAHALGIEEPKVAILSAVETVNPKIESTIEAAALCKMADRGQITGGILDGPLAFDNAVSEEAAKTKHIVSPVTGVADILLVPDLESGNMLAKQLSYLAGAESAGIVLGTRVPIVLTSRADSVRSRLASTAVMALVAHARRTGKLPVR